MYSGTTFTKYSGRIIGTHQKIDRVARRLLMEVLDDDAVFPRGRQILQFEGKNGPDAIKRKSPAKDEPWHYYSPFNDDDAQLIELITDHYNLLVKELKKINKTQRAFGLDAMQDGDEKRTETYSEYVKGASQSATQHGAKNSSGVSGSARKQAAVSEGSWERVAFEAAWLAHALVDGLTPAHHYPYEEKLVELRGGLGIETRTTIKEKLVMPGDTKRQKVKNNWKMWGPKGLFTTHTLFEMGIATMIAPLSLGEAKLTPEDLKTIQEIGVAEWFKRTAREIAVLEMYDRFYKRGWTQKLVFDVRHKLAPSIVKTVALAWYAALCEAGLIKK